MNHPTSYPDGSDQNPVHRFRFWNLWMMLLVVSTAAGGLIGCGEGRNRTANKIVVRDLEVAKSATKLLKDSPQPAHTVTLSVDFGKSDAGRLRSKPILLQVKWTEGLTALEVLKQAVPKIEVEYKGSGESCFITSIGGQANNNSEQKFWMYRVNDKMADVGCDAYPLKPEDQVLWRLGNGDDY